jgi:CheY-like chemotaxis protein/HPt (histidine-containing phosphotransfer) domain-containing protein
MSCVIPTNAQAAEALGALRERYRASSPRRVATFRLLAAQLTIAPDAPETLKHVRRQLHRVRGNAGTFGFLELSRVAAGLEERADGWAEDPALDRGVRASIIAHFASLIETHVCGVPPLPPRAGAAPQAAAPRATFEIPEVIVVEDDPSLADMLRYALESTGHTALFHTSGPTALEALLALDPGERGAVVLLDVDLPGLDGFSLYDRLCATRPGAFGVVFFTVHASEAEQLRAYRAGAMDYVIKPVNMRILMARIPSWIASAHARVHA